MQGGEVLVGDDGGAGAGAQGGNHPGGLAELVAADQDVVGALGQCDGHDDPRRGSGLEGRQGAHRVPSSRSRRSSAAIASSTTTSCGSSREISVMSASA